MDISAIIHAPDSLLEDMGLCKVGDMLSLKGFCTREVEKDNSKEEEQKKEQKRCLLEAFFNRKKVKKSKLQSTSRIPVAEKGALSVKSRKIQLGWKHFSEKQEKFILVPLAKGGGSRTVDMPLSSNRVDLMRASRELFFPNEESMFGNAEEMELDIANFKDEPIHVTINSGNGVLPFNLRNYIEMYKSKTVRIYLRSKLKRTTESDDITLDDLPSMLDPSPESSLIGSSEDRRAILEDQNRKYEESLRIDEVKKQRREDALKEKLKEEEQKEQTRKARLARVPPEPGIDDDVVTVRVRHKTVGLQTRKFLNPCLVSSVYDWAGSFTPDPKDFTLCDPDGVVLQPNSVLADRNTLTMVPSKDGTPSLSLSDDEIQFKGFGKAHDRSTDTVPDLFVHEPDGDLDEPLQGVTDADPTREEDSL